MGFPAPYMYTFETRSYKQRLPNGRKGGDETYSIIPSTMGIVCAVIWLGCGDDDDIGGKINVTIGGSPIIRERLLLYQ